MGLPVHPKPRKYKLCIAKLYSENNPRDFFHVEQSSVCGFRSNQYTSLAWGFYSTVSSHPSLLTQQSLGMALNFMNFINTWMQFTSQCLGSRLKYFILEEIFWNVLLCPCVLAVIYVYVLMLTSATSCKICTLWCLLDHLPPKFYTFAKSRYLLKLSHGSQATLPYLSDILEEQLPEKL